jgi:4'-phosphopantetheinyl transferase
MADLRFHPRERPAPEALDEHVVALIGPGVVTSGRLCPACGSDQHGAPWARLDGRPVSVSLSRSGPHLVTAVAPNGRIGVDIESIDAVAGRWDPALVLATGETAGTAEKQAWHWAAKEAVLKALGVGLARPMSSIILADHAGALAAVEAPAGYVAVLARL